MTSKIKFTNRLISLFLCVALVMAYLPMSVITASAAENRSRVSDPITMDGWKEFFLPKDGSLTTENAGGVWTDKSVFTDDVAFSDSGITKDSDESFLVALSAIASNMTVTGVTGNSTDTILVLDVSGSMNNNEGNNNVASELVTAANESIEVLLSTNSENRVGVVLYSGPEYENNSGDSGDASVMLPLGRYETSDAQGKFLDYTLSDGDEYISLNGNVVKEGTATKPSAGTKEVVGATYIQMGIELAKDQFLAAEDKTDRKPVLVLMSDGAPTLGDTDFTDPGRSNLGSGSGTSAALGFVTQLTAANAKFEIEKGYGAECLFYTLGLGTASNTVATSVLDPENSSSAISELWDSYTSVDLEVGDRLRVQRAGLFTSAKYVTKTDVALERVYVDKYFNSADYGGDLAAAIVAAFKDIVSEIQLQSKYYPTLVEGSDELSGYISFTDKIGEYMNVTDIKGIMIHNDLFSGSDLASNFVAGGGLLGTFDNPSDLGNEMVWAVQARLGIENPDIARALIGLAYENGQLSYTDENEFSNYIGWYANAAGQYLGFWHEGITTMPDPTDEGLTDATRPAYIIKSYGYLGEVDAAHGVSKSDMMYATVQVRKDIATGEETVLFAVPAALIPTVTYEVTLNERNEITDLTASGATEPIRLVYEVALDSRINEYNVKEVVSAEYLAAHTDDGGSINFYTNQYETDNSVGYGKDNTFSYFRPSKENDRYYYQEDVTVYTADHVPYKETEKPAGTMYHAYTVYTKDASGNVDEELVFHTLTEEALGAAVWNELEQVWYIPAGTVRRDYSGFVQLKSENTSGTLFVENAPFTDIYGHSVTDLNHRFTFGVTMGNNGRITLVPETGIKISKALRAGTAATDAVFEFSVENTSNADDNNTYPAYRVSASGATSNETVKFDGGVATVSLNVGDVLYIGGMNEGDIISVSEVETADYKVFSVNNDESATEASVEVIGQEFVAAAFENETRLKGSLTIAKEVEHDFAASYEMPEGLKFKIDVTLSGVGTAEATFAARQTNSEITEIKTDENGAFTIYLEHNERLEIEGLPAGTSVTVVEDIEANSGFTPAYWDSGVLGDGIVEVIGNNTVSVIVVNDYSPASVYPVNIEVSGNKILQGREWDESDTFNFQLQKWIPATSADAEGTWEVLGEASVKDEQAEKSFDFTNAFANEEYTASGTYYYRIVEIEPETGALGGITYDKTVHSFSVLVEDRDMNGKLEIGNVISSRPETTIVTAPETENGAWTVAANFTNTYANGSTTATVDINKKVINNSGSSKATLAGFTFGLYDESGTLVTESMATTDRGFTRLVLTFTEEGTYKYTLKEMVPDLKPDEWKYSEAELAVTVVVTDNNDGTLSAVITDNGANAENADTSIETTFTNEYIPGAAEFEFDFVSKELSGKALSGEDFTFEVHEYFPETETTSKLFEGTNDANGTVTFGKLTYTKVGTYFYNIFETSEDGNGITVDKTVYRVSVTVSDAGGNLSTSYVLVNAESNNIVFKNSYTVKPVSKAIDGTKSLTGRSLVNDEFTFIMTEALDANGNVADGAATYEAKNLTDGKFTFPEITYTAAGTYYYTVKEFTEVENTYGITYDTKEFVVTLEITDDGKGNLVAEKPTFTVKGNGAASGLVFVNEYKASPTIAEIGGNKVLTGKVLTEGAFEFELYESNEAWEEVGEALETVANAENGAIIFTELPYEAAGVYHYIVKEVNGGEVIDGVIYDDTIYRVTVTVTDDLRGQLHSVITLHDQENIPQESIEFNNAYEITSGAEVTLGGTKVLDGRNLNEGEFRFVLTPADEGFENLFEEYAIETFNKLDGSFEFETLGFEEIGAYHFVITEDGTVDVANVEFDDTVYYVTVYVSDGGNGSLVAEYEITTEIGGDTLTEEIVFNNTYNPPVVPPPQTGDTNNFFLWAALLFISGGVMLATMFRKKEV